MIQNNEGGNLHEPTLFGGGGRGAGGAARGVGALHGSERRGNGLGDLAGHLLGGRDNRVSLGTQKHEAKAKGEMRQGGIERRNQRQGE